jgi:hypothetical protein
MQDVARILCLGDAAEADALLQQWRDCVPTPTLTTWAGTKMTRFDPDVMLLPAGENALTLYWVHLLAIGRSSPAGLEGCRRHCRQPLAARHHDWQWDRASGRWHGGRLDSLAAHLARQELALLRLRTDEDACALPWCARRCRHAAAGTPGPGHGGRLGAWRLSRHPPPPAAKTARQFDEMKNNFSSNGEYCIKISKTATQALPPCSAHACTCG